MSLYVGNLKIFRMPLSLCLGHSPIFISMGVTVIKSVAFAFANLSTELSRCHQHCKGQKLLGSPQGAQIKIKICKKKGTKLYKFLNLATKPTFRPVHKVVEQPIHFSAQCSWSVRTLKPLEGTFSTIAEGTGSIGKPTRSTNSITLSMVAYQVWRPWVCCSPKFKTILPPSS